MYGLEIGEVKQCRIYLGNLGNKDNPVAGVADIKSETSSIPSNFFWAGARLGIW